MEVVVKARIKETERGNWKLVLYTNDTRKSELLRMFFKRLCPHWTNRLILSPVSTSADNGELSFTLDIFRGPDQDTEEKWEFLKVSLTDLANEMARQGMNPSEVSRRATEDFPQTVQKYLDEGWEILMGDSRLVYLKKNHLGKNMPSSYR